MRNPLNSGLWAARDQRLCLTTSIPDSNTVLATENLLVEVAEPTHMKNVLLCWRPRTAVSSGLSGFNKPGELPGRLRLPFHVWTFSGDRLPVLPPHTPKALLSLPKTSNADRTPYHATRPPATVTHEPLNRDHVYWFCSQEQVSF